MRSMRTGRTERDDKRSQKGRARREGEGKLKEKGKCRRSVESVASGGRLGRTLQLILGCKPEAIGPCEGCRRDRWDGNGYSKTNGRWMQKATASNIGDAVKIAVTENKSKTSKTE